MIFSIAQSALLIVVYLEKIHRCKFAHLVCLLFLVLYLPSLLPISYQQANSSRSVLALKRSSFASQWHAFKRFFCVKQEALKQLGFTLVGGVKHDNHRYIDIRLSELVNVRERDHFPIIGVTRNVSVLNHLVCLLFFLVLIFAQPCSPISVSVRIH